MIKVPTSHIEAGGQIQIIPLKTNSYTHETTISVR